jgi:hypothetical protein
MLKTCSGHSYLWYNTSEGLRGALGAVVKVIQGVKNALYNI